MTAKFEEFRRRARVQADELLEAIATAEAIIVATIERECEALRGNRMLAAEALHLRLCDGARLYVNATRAARASLWTIERAVGGSGQRFENRRAAFADILKVELAVLAAERAAAEAAASPAFAQTRAPASERFRSAAEPHSAAGPAFRVVAGQARDPAPQAEASAARRSRR